jgi:hypothetical protein
MKFATYLIVLIIFISIIGCEEKDATGPEDIPSPYSMADLVGEWHFNGLATGLGAPWWERGKITIDEDGVVTGLGYYFDEQNSHPIQNTISISPEGIITQASGDTTFRGSLDTDKTVLVGTATWLNGSPNTTELKIGVKIGSSYTLSDLKGEWYVNSLASGIGAPWWEHGKVVIDEDGFCFGIVDEYQSDPDTISGTLSINNEGVVTISNNDIYWGAMDAGKTLIAGTNTWSTKTSTTISIMVKKGSSYSLTDLAGYIEVSSIASGPGAPWWQRGPASVDNDGTFFGILEEYDSDPDTISGTFDITSDGIVTIASFEDPALFCVVDAGKSLIVRTSTWSSGSPGTSELSIATKMAE